MQKTLSVAVVLAVGCLVSGTASAIPIDFSAGPLGDLGASQATYAIPGDPDERSMLVSGFYYNGTNWDDANLYRRRQTNDNGLGVCNPNESPCPGPSGGGDINELDNSGTPELIRLMLPDGFTWTSVGLSSLDNNDGAGPERGQLWADDDDDLSNGFGTLIAQFEFEGIVEPDILIPLAFMSTPYLIFQPIDWSTPTLSASTSTFTNNTFYYYKKTKKYNNTTTTTVPQPSTNNDFLVRAALITEQRVPEPSTLLLLAAGLGFAAVGRRRS